MTDLTSYHRSVQRTLAFVFALNLLVAGLKLFTGLQTGSVAIVASAFDSLVDGSSNVVGMVGLAVASRPPDANHPYGHRKYETIATLAIGALLLIASWEILTSAISRLRSGVAPEVNLLSLGLMLATLPVNILVTIYEARQARRLHSDLLQADATHTRADVIVTVSVLIGLVGVLLGIPWLDAVIGLLVVGVIAWAAFGILGQTSRVLTDSAAVDPGIVNDIARSVPGVWFTHRVRSRGQPDASYVDLHVKVDPAMSTLQAHAIASEVERRLRADIQGVVDAVVHIEPGRHMPDRPYEHLLVRVRQIADGLGVGIHNVHFDQTSQGTEVQLHVEVDGRLSLEAAHALATQLETRIQQELPSIAHVETHIEPLPDVVTLAPDETDLERLKRQVQQMADEVWGEPGCHHVTLHQVGHYTEVVLHCTMPGDVPLVEAHERAEQVERRLLTDLPAVNHVVVHVEPIGAEE